MDLTESITYIDNWAQHHSNPDGQLLVAAGQSWSPRQIAEEVQKETELGRQLLEAVMLFVKM